MRKTTENTTAKTTATAEAIETKFFNCKQFANDIKTTLENNFYIDVAYNFDIKDKNNAFFNICELKENDKKTSKRIFSLYVLDSKTKKVKIETKIDYLTAEIIQSINADLEITYAKNSTEIKAHFVNENIQSATAIINAILTAYAEKKAKAEAEKQQQKQTTAEATAEKQKQTATKQKQTTATVKKQVKKATKTA